MFFVEGSEPVEFPVGGPSVLEEDHAGEDGDGKGEGGGTVFEDASGEVVGAGGCVDVDGIEEFADPASAENGKVGLFVRRCFGGCGDVGCGSVVVGWFEFLFECFGEGVGMEGVGALLLRSCLLMFHHCLEFLGSVLKKLAQLIMERFVARSKMSSDRPDAPNLLKRSLRSERGRKFRSWSQR